MKAVDYRNESFDQVKSRIDSTRSFIWQRMQEAASALTTREIAELTGVDLLTVRPRVTELLQLGFVEVAGGAGHEGRYRALSNFEALRVYEERARIARDPQLSLAGI